MLLRSLSICLLFGTVCRAANAQSLTDAVNLPGGVTPSDWSSIRRAHDAVQHAAHATVDGFAARNPGQGWLTTFDRRGFTVQPNDGAWTWGLQLERYGCTGNEQEVCDLAAVTIDGPRVTYRWDDTLEEWWVNDIRGLEHGFTVMRRPAIESDRLTLRLGVRGDLRIDIAADAHGAQFVDSKGAAVVDYAGLFAWDATGRALDARMEPSADGFSISVSTTDARYPLTIDPFAQHAYLKASNTDQYDHFGNAVAISGDTVVVGASYECSAATGVNGNQLDDSACESGAVYVFVRSGTTWSQQAYLKASNSQVGDHFGEAVGISGDTIVVGAKDEDSAATGIDGNQLDNTLSFAGAAYVFVRNGTTWSQQAYLKASQPGAFTFGWSVAVSGDTVIVGAPQEKSIATGVNGNQLDHSAVDAGAAYVFVRSGTTWSQEAYLKASNTQASDFFGFSVGISGNTTVVGALLEDSSTTGVNGNQLDNNTLNSGAAYVFVRNGTTWSQQAYLKSSGTDVNDRFGTSVAVSGDTVVIGAFYEDRNATGVNGIWTDNSATDSGAAYVFVRSGQTWSQEAYLKASNAAAGDWFGWPVSIWNDKIVVGARQEDSNATGVNGNQLDNSVSSAGAAYVFYRTGTTWTQQFYLKGAAPGPDNLGAAVAISGRYVVVGAPLEDSSATGVNGDPFDNSLNAAGAVLVFSHQSQSTPFCFGDGTGTGCPCANNGAVGHGCASAIYPGGALLTSDGGAGVSANTDTLVLTAADLAGPGLFFQYSGLSSPFAFGDGRLCATAGFIRLGIVFPTGGIASYPGGLTPNPIHVAGSTSLGDVRHYQCWYRSVPGLCSSQNFNLTQGLTLTWEP
jgi:hypothetical protein